MAPRPAVVPIGYQDGDTLDKLIVFQAERWLQFKGHLAFLFCWASRCMVRADQFSNEQRNLPLKRMRYSQLRPQGLPIAAWVARAERNFNDNTCVDADKEQNRAFAAFMGKSTGHWFRDGDGNQITTDKAAPSARRKRCQLSFMLMRLRCC